MSRIEELTKQLLAELKAQNYTVDTDEKDLGHIDIWIYKGRLSVQNTGEWEIECGEVAK